MKIIKGIFGFIFFLVTILISISLFFIMSWSVEYSKYDETGIMKNGNLCISHVCEGAGGWADEYYNSDNSVLKEDEDFSISKPIYHSSAVGAVFGKVYKPVNCGTSDIYVGYAVYGGEQINKFEVYHVKVDKDLNITYSVEIIDKERFEQNQNFYDMQ